jgi:hypothetical protein
LQYRQIARMTLAVRPAILRSMRLITLDKLKDSVTSRCKVDPQTGCWIWQGGRSEGYGIVAARALGRQNMRTHRVMYLLTFGEPNGVIHHDCENKLCCNPEHLRDVSPTEHRSLHCSETCPAGHSANWRTTRRGTRYCRDCDRERQARNRRDPQRAERIRDQLRQSRRRRRYHA